MQDLLDIMHFKEGAMPFTYLGAPIFKRSSKKQYFKKIVDKIVARCATWKGMLLSMAGRVQLAKSVIQGMMVYTMMVYQRPKELLHQLESKINNFVWSGDVHKRGVHTVKWRLMQANGGGRCWFEKSDTIQQCMLSKAVF